MIDDDYLMVWKGTAQVSLLKGHNLATNSDGHTDTREAVLTRLRRNHTARQTDPSTGTRNAKRQLKRRSCRQSSCQPWVNPGMAKRRVRYAKDTNAAMVLQKLTGRCGGMTVGKPHRAKPHHWEFGPLREFIAYQAQLSGVGVVWVKPRNSSRSCSRCGFISKRNRRSQAQFPCIGCGHGALSYLNASRNLVARGDVTCPD